MPSPYPIDEVRRVLAHYIVFRHVQKAHQRGWVSEASFDRLSEELRQGVSRSWERLFPGMDAVARTWAGTRIDFLLAQQLMPEDTARLMRKRLQDLGGGDRPGPTGSLAFLWRLHTLYIVLAEAAERGDIPPPALRRVIDVIHDRALDQVNAALKLHGHRGVELLGQVLAAARAQVEEFRDREAMFPEEAKYLLGALAPLPGAAGAGVAPASRTTRRALGNCRVCGFDIEEKVSCFCSQCETPHHRDCWKYNGGCATFACKSTITSRDRPQLLVDGPDQFQ